MRSVTIPAFAKINLCLHILGKRADGYHELRTIFQTISLHDTLRLSLARGWRIEIECDDPALPAGRENLVWQALDALQRELGMRSGVRARLTKRIPVGGGLGGGSSNAAAALVGLLRLTRRELPARRLLELAAALGADVPFFLLGGRALGVGRGDEIYSLPDTPRRSVLLVSPKGISISTRDAYGWAGRRLTKRGGASKIYAFCALCWSSRDAALHNDFEPAVFAKHRRLRQLKRGLLEHGAMEAALAGSGSAVFGLYQHPAQARRAAESFPDDQTFVVETLSREEYRKALGLDRVCK